MKEVIKLLYNYNDDFHIYILTYNRAEIIKTHKIFPHAFIVCPESQLAEYKKYNPDMNYFPCPDEIDGNLARKRNWVKENCPKNWFIFADDDISYFQMIEDRKAIRLEHDHLIEIMFNAFIMTEELGTVLWGINMQTDPMFYREVAPINFLSPVCGPFSGHIKSNMKYDERLPFKEDFDYSLQVLHKYHKLLRFNKYSYKAQHIIGEGGSHSFRRMKTEEEQNALLQKKWGKKVVRYDMSKDIDPIVKVPLKGV